MPLPDHKEYHGRKVRIPGNKDWGRPDQVGTVVWAGWADWYIVKLPDGTDYCRETAAIIKLYLLD